MLFDTHAHYDDERFDEDRDALLASMPENNVGLILNPGCDVETSRKAVSYANRYPFVYAAVGLHPENIGRTGGDPQTGKKRAACPRDWRNRSGLLLGEGRTCPYPSAGRIRPPDGAGA